VRRISRTLGFLLLGGDATRLNQVQRKWDELVINVKSKALGLDVPATRLARADEVIE
jgi:hypothetical protein